MTKRAFSLVEVLVSIALFSIILIFLYDTLDITTKSNQFYSNKLEIKQDKNHLRKIFFSDFINKMNTDINIIEDKNTNSILLMQSNNTYHNPFNTHITYLLTQEGNLMRIESEKLFEETSVNDIFFTKASVDTLEKNVKKLKIKESNQKYYFYIEYIDNTTFLFSF